MKRIVAVHSNTYHGFTLDQAIDGIRDAGFRYIELSATTGWTEHVSTTMSFATLCAVQGQLRQAGLAPFALSGHTNLMDPARIGSFLDNMRLAHFFGAQYIVSSIGEAHLTDGHVASLAEVTENIRGLLPALEQYGLTLVLETHGEHNTGRLLKQIVDPVDSPRVRINYDTANVIYYADVDPTADIPTCIEAIGYLHIKDKAGGRQEWNFPALGEGYVDFPEILNLLEQAGNSSPFSIEIEFTQAGPKDLAEVNQAVRSSYQYLASLGLDI